MQEDFHLAGSWRSYRERHNDEAAQDDARRKRAARTGVRNDCREATEKMPSA
jgi:hypothetical protein